MSSWQRRIVSFANSTVAVEYSGARAAAMVNFLFGDAPAQSDIPPHIIYRLAPGEDGNLVLLQNGVQVLAGSSDGTVAEFLLGDVCHHLADQSKDGILLHAAVLTWRGFGVLLPGGIGAGKTTLTTWLVAKGLDYLTDEMAFVPHGADYIEAFTRPLNLKKSSRPALRSTFDCGAFTDLILMSADSDLIPPRILKSDNILSTPQLGLIVFPQYLPDCAGEVQPLSRAQAGLALMQSLVNARNLPEYGFSEIARLAQSVPAYKLRYSQFDQIEQQINTWLDAFSSVGA
jgi:hypothetical protein